MGNVIASIPAAEKQRVAGALLLSRNDVERLLGPAECIDAVEDAFRQHALGNTPSPESWACTPAPAAFM